MPGDDEAERIERIKSYMKDLPRDGFKPIRIMERENFKVEETSDSTYIKLNDGADLAGPAHGRHRHPVDGRSGRPRA